jgi:excisionase family DNA binding protein
MTQESAWQIGDYNRRLLFAKCCYRLSMMRKIDGVNANPDSLLTPSQVADELQVTVVTVRRWIAHGGLRASKAGPRRWMVRRADLAAFLKSAPPERVESQTSEDPAFRRYLVVPE